MRLFHDAMVHDRTRCYCGHEMKYNHHLVNKRLDLYCAKCERTCMFFAGVPDL